MLNSVKINREELLQIVKTNREKHIEEYNEAIENWKRLYRDALDTFQASLDKGTPIEFSDINLEKPQSYENHYNQVIRMLELSVEENIDVNNSTFNQIVMDEWAWTYSFKNSSSSYSSSSSSSSFFNNI